MSFKEFDMTDIKEAKAKYQEEANQRWGDTDAYKESVRKTGSYTKEDWEKITKEAEEIYAGFIAVMGKGPESSEARQLAIAWQTHISTYYYSCSDDMLAGLGSMYISDERFKTNIDKRQEGLAEFMNNAIQSYCKLAGLSGQAPPSRQAQ